MCTSPLARIYEAKRRINLQGGPSFKRAYVQHVTSSTLRHLVSVLNLHNLGTGFMSIDGSFTAPCP